MSTPKVQEKSESEHLPADRPLPPTSAGFEAPNEKLSSSMLLVIPCAWDSPATPSIKRYASLAIATPPHNTNDFQDTMRALFETGVPVQPGYAFAAAGSSAPRRRETFSSSSCKCGRKYAIARYTPGLPLTSSTSTRSSRRGNFAL